MNKATLLLLVTAVAGLSGCGIFGGGKDDVEPPAELVEFESTLPVVRLWSERIGGGSERLRLGLSPAADGVHVFVGAYDGTVASLDITSGDELWSVETGAQLAAGPGVGGGLLVFGTSDGQLIALDAETGAERWRQDVDSEVLASPAVGSNVVVFRSVDGRLRGLSAANGTTLWTVEQSMPALTLRGNSVPRISGTVVVAGFDNGRVGAYALTTGEPRWELAIASPTGRNELERLVDVSTDLQIVGNDVFVSSYHGRAVGIDIVTGLVIWQQDMSSFAGLGADSNFVYVTDDVDSVIALERSSGNEVWRQAALRLRDVTAPTRFGRAVVVGDFEGYLHFLDPVNGDFLARVRGASAQISAQPVVSGSALIVQAEDGTVAAFGIPDESD